MSAVKHIDRYRVERLLGSGAFASVWLAHDDELDSAVAIKVLADNWSRHPDVRERFLTEARLLRKADSDRILRVLDLGELENGQPYFVTNYADRGSLEDRLTEGELSISEALRIASEVAEAVCVLHEKEVIHRDLKPSNVLFHRGAVDNEERTLLADLGLAKALAHSSGLTVMAGSPGYMAPEQAQPGGKIDARTDVYGLGALTYRLLTGVTPDAPGGKPVPSEIHRTVARALRADPRRRWPTMRTLADQLHALTARKWKSRHTRRLPRFTRGRILVAGLLILALLGVGLWRWGPNLRDASSASKNTVNANACQDNDVSFTETEAGSQADSAETEFSLLVSALETPRGPVSCAMQGYLTDIRFLDAAGRQLPVVSRKFQFIEPDRIPVKPDWNAEIDIRWKRDIRGGSQVQPTTLEFRLPGSKAASRIPWQGGSVDTTQPVYFSAAMQAGG